MNQFSSFLHARVHVLEQIVEGGEVTDTLNILCRETEEIDPAMRCSVLYYDQDTNCLRHAAGPSLPDYYNDAIDGLQSGMGVGSCGTAAFTGERVIVEDVFSHPYWEAFRDLAKKVGFHACWSQPIYSKNKEVLGTFAMYYDEVRRPTEEGLQLIQAQANLASLAIERKRNEEALQQSEERFKDFTNASSDWFWEMGPDLRFTSYSPRVEKAIGVSLNWLIGKTREEQGRPEIDDEKWIHHLDALKAHEPFKDFEYGLTREDGTKAYVQSSGIPVFGNDGEFLGYRGTGTNITRRVVTDEELKQHRDHLEELVAQRTTEVQEKAAQLEEALESEKQFSAMQQKFVALVSHEFRTPLAIIDGTAQRLIRRKDKLDANDIEMRANKVRSAVERMIGLIDTTLYTSQLDAGKIEMKRSLNDIGELLLDVCERQVEIAPEHQFDVEVKDLPKEMLIDHGLIDQVFTNLVSNAVKYAPLAPHIEVKGWQENGYVIVTVTDQGIGIPKDEMPHMFTRFFRASTAEGYKGTGLGLSVCKEFVEMHDGTIEVASVEGQGTTCSVRLPIDVNSL